MPEKLTPEIRAKIINLRKEGKSFVQIEAELEFKKGSLSHISSRSWFISAMKEKGEDGKTGYQEYKKALLAALKETRKKRKGDREEKRKKEKESPGAEDGKATSKEGIDKEVESHLQGSDKDLRRGKKKKEPGAGGGDGDKVKKEKGKKGNGGLLIVLIIIVVALLIIALFMIFRRKEKEGEKEPEFDGRLPGWDSP